ncbi:NUDIX domain-containing protein [Polyangium aurulentum]|uniref:NUDIX domain-containing protein n=1 Tax=Polyangium aurulentum TaxID=2567896 RepID=UPI0010AE2469|nr:NUDIX hydrolase [Polyangium aurulentum]UQA56415.1 NUDIX hydrolase [Polyangium aurulentum]
MSEGDKRTSSSDYPRPSLTADVVLFSLDDAHRLAVLLIQRGKDPFAGHWAIPGGFCEPGESVEESAARELQEETGIEGLPLDQLKTFSRPGRDPRGWVVSVAHVSVLPSDRRAEAVGGDDASEARWWTIVRERDGSLGLEHGGERGAALAFDHDEILKAAVEHLGERVEQLALGMLPATFTLEDARRAFEAALGCPVDIASFEEAVFDEELVEEAGGGLLRVAGGGR